MSELVTARPSSLDEAPRLAKYELLEELGHGGMATVYRARDRRLGREVAVKVLHRHLRENEEAAARFIDEARAAAKLRHPAIVEVFDVSAEDERERYLVVELMRGTTLRALLAKAGRLPPEVAAALVLRLAEAADHAHTAGVVHRDIKPENVLIELRAPPDGGGAPEEVLVKLTDFGIAKLLDGRGLTMTGQVLGSPGHMAPEQIEAGEVDARTDVFGLGVVLYECLVGHLPFEGKNPAQVLRRVLSGDFRAAEGERPEVGARWSSLVARALAHDPCARFATARELGEALRSELTALGAAPPEEELRAFFCDPDAYVAALPGRLVPRLVARAEAARRKGDVLGAVSDLNRAVALAPSDLTLLRRVRSLAARGKRRLRLGVAALVGVVVVGLVFVARGRRRPLIASPEPDAGAPLLGGPAPALESSSAPLALQSAAPTVPSTAESFRGRLPRAWGAAGASRRVKFVVTPKGATLLVDGRKVSWFSGPVRLAPGAHLLDAAVEGSRCCRALRRSETVTPAPVDAPDEEQLVQVALEILPSRVVLEGAPPNGQLACPGLGLSVFPGAAGSVRLSEPVWDGRCSFRAPDKAQIWRRVELRAGEPNTLLWPPG